MSVASLWPEYSSSFHRLKMQNKHFPSLDGILAKSNSGLLILYPIAGWNIKMLICGVAKWVFMISACVVGVPDSFSLQNILFGTWLFCWNEHLFANRAITLHGAASTLVCVIAFAAQIGALVMANKRIDQINLSVNENVVSNLETHCVKRPSFSPDVNPFQTDILDTSHLFAVCNLCLSFLLGIHLQDDFLVEGKFSNISKHRLSPRCMLDLESGFLL